MSRLDWAVLLLAAAVVVGTYRGLSRGISLEDLRSELRPPGYLLVTYAVARHATRERGKAAKAFTLLVILSVLVAIKTAAVYALVPLAPAGEPERILLATRVLNSDGFKRILPQGADLALARLSSCSAGLLRSARAHRG
jgi:hypothetical protein